jgi:UDP-4-amino-4,6-dideoxy-N-acetyl-beta-L-altrosamine N-acetyltransferase
MLGSLIAIDDSNFEIIREWRNQPLVRRNMYTTHEISSDEHIKWWDRTKSREDCRYFIYELSGVPSGVVGFTSIDARCGHAFWAFYAAPNAARGTGGRMEYLALEHVFGTLGLRKLSCEVLSFNVPVLRLHEKFGFQVEGVFVEQHKADEGWADVHRLAIFKDRWDKHKNIMLEKLSAMIRE